MWTALSRAMPDAGFECLHLAGLELLIAAAEVLFLRGEACLLMQTAQPQQGTLFLLLVMRQVQVVARAESVLMRVALH